MSKRRRIRRRDPMKFIFWVLIVGMFWLCYATQYAPQYPLDDTGVHHAELVQSSPVSGGVVEHEPDTDAAGRGDGREAGDVLGLTCWTCSGIHDTPTPQPTPQPYPPPGTPWPTPTEWSYP